MPVKVNCEFFRERGSRCAIKPKRWGLLRQKCEPVSILVNGCPDMVKRLVTRPSVEIVINADQ